MTVSRDLDLSDPYELALASDIGSPDILVLASTLFPSSVNSLQQKAYLLVVPISREPVLVGATAWSPRAGDVYVKVKELGPVSVLTRRRLPADIQSDIELDRPEGRSLAEAAGGDHVSSLFYTGLSADSVCLVRSLTPGIDDPVRLSFVAQWREDGAPVSEVIWNTSTTELRALVEREFEVALKDAAP